jgi:hypothetical protein
MESFPSSGLYVVATSIPEWNKDYCSTTSSVAGTGAIWFRSEGSQELRFSESGQKYI